MKTLKIFVILCIMFRFGLESIMAQAPQKASYNVLNRITSISIGNWDTTFWRANTSEIYQLTGGVQDWIVIPEKTSFAFITTNGTYYDLMNKPVLYNSTRIKLAEESVFMAGFGSSSTFIGKWERLTGKPIFDTTSVSYYPLKRTDAPTLSDNHFYRLTGNIFNMIMNVKYPSRNSPK